MNQLEAKLINPMVLFIVFILVTSNAYAGIRFPINKVWSFLTNKRTMEFLFYGSFLTSQACDGLKDAYYFNTMYHPEERLRVINDKNYHVIKNLGRLSLLVSGITLGGAIAKEQITFKQGAYRLLSASCYSYPVWRGAYTYARWGDWWDTKGKHNEHLIPYTDWTLQDKYISLKDWQVSTFYVGLIGCGLGLQICF